MNDANRDAIKKLAQLGTTLDTLADVLVKVVFDPGLQGEDVAGTKFSRSDVPGTLFDFAAHQQFFSLRYVHALDKGELSGHIGLCRQRADGSLGDVILMMALRQGGNLEMPDGDKLDLHNLQKSDFATIRRQFYFQLLGAVQASLIKS